MAMSAAMITMVAVAAQQLHPPLQQLLLRRALLLLLPALVLLSGGVQGGLPCEYSGYCSLGKTTPYVGEVDTAIGLRKALISRSYKREVILMATDTKQVLGALQAVANLHRLGLEHVLMMSGSAPECARVAMALTTVGCAWLEWELPVLGAERDMVPEAAPLWHNRYRLAARAVRMKYNVFLVDTDVIFFDDPYLYFKSQPFANFTIINQPEVLYDQGDYLTESSPNGGVLYVQNAAPNGPAAWLLSEVIARLLRWLEDGFQVSRYAHDIATWCNYMDQDGLKDGLSSVRLGRIFFGFAARECRTAAWRAAHEDKHAAIQDAILQLLAADTASGGGAIRQDEEVELPPALRGAAGERAVTLRYFEMRMPAYKPWDDKYGPYLFPSARGILSKQWIQQLREDCNCPLWPDPEEPSEASAAAAIPSERYLLAPPFLMLNWFARGRKGFWHRTLSPAGPQQVVGHIHYVPGTSPSVGKAVVKMAVGHYDWQLARQVLGPRMYFLHQGRSSSHALVGSETRGLASLHLLALHPSLVTALGSTRSWEEYMELIRGLAAAAVVLRRVPVWPDPPCAAPWIAEAGGEGAATLPLTIRQEFIPYGRRTTGLSCVWLPLLTEGCLYDGRGMLNLEFVHWRHRMRLLPHIEPDKRNTIGYVSAELGPPGPFTNGSTATSRMISLPRDDLARVWSLKRTQPFKVLYLMNPLRPILPRGTAETNALAQVLEQCKAMNHADMVQDLLDKPYKEPAEPVLKFVAAALGMDGDIRAATDIPGYNMPAANPQAQAEEQGRGSSDIILADASVPSDAVDAAAAAAVVAAAAAATTAAAAATVPTGLAWEAAAAAVGAAAAAPVAARATTQSSPWSSTISTPIERPPEDNFGTTRSGNSRAQSTGGCSSSNDSRGGGAAASTTTTNIADLLGRNGNSPAPSGARAAAVGSPNGSSSWAGGSALASASALSSSSSAAAAVATAAASTAESGAGSTYATTGPAVSSESSSAADSFNGGSADAAIPQEGMMAGGAASLELEEVEQHLMDNEMAAAGWSHRQALRGAAGGGSGNGIGSRDGGGGCVHFRGGAAAAGQRLAARM